MTSGGRTGKQVEVYLYDLTPGGAGFVGSAAVDPKRLFEEALVALGVLRLHALLLRLPPQLQEQVGSQVPRPHAGRGVHSPRRQR